MGPTGAVDFGALSLLDRQIRALESLSPITFCCAILSAREEENRAKTDASEFSIQRAIVRRVSHMSLCREES